MRILVTGADGFLGRRVVDKLLAAGSVGAGADPISRLVLVDLHMGRTIDDPRVVPMVGSFTDAAVRVAALDGGVDLLFHLASVPGGAAQAHYERGRAVNLDGSLALVDAVCDRARNGTRNGSGKPPIVVYASSIAAIGAAHLDVVTDDIPLRPHGSYGHHKLMLELHLADLTARGWLDARSLRPAGIVPRPRATFEGFATAWMSDVFHAIAAGEAFEVPVPPDATTWLQSLDCVADNVLHAAGLQAAPSQSAGLPAAPSQSAGLQAAPSQSADLPAAGPQSAHLQSTGLPAHRAWTLPALNPRMDDLVQAIALQTVPAHADKVRFAAPAGGSTGRGTRMPEQRLPLTAALGFRHDGTLATLVQRALRDVRDVRGSAAA